MQNSHSCRCNFTKNFLGRHWCHRGTLQPSQSTVWQSGTSRLRSALQLKDYITPNNLREKNLKKKTFPSLPAVNRDPRLPKKTFNVNLREMRKGKKGRSSPYQSIVHEQKINNNSANASVKHPARPRRFNSKWTPQNWYS